MSRTYQAHLRGNRLEWDDEAPKDTASDRPVRVEVTVLEEQEHEPSSVPGAPMAAILEKLAVLDAFAEIEDASTWQHRTRKDRALPGRASEQDA